MKKGRRHIRDRVIQGEDSGSGGTQARKQGSPGRNTEGTYGVSLCEAGAVVTELVHGWSVCVFSIKAGVVWRMLIAHKN